MVWEGGDGWTAPDMQHLYRNGMEINIFSNVDVQCLFETLICNICLYSLGYIIR